jgi:hypothetical protein
MIPFRQSGRYGDLASPVFLVLGHSRLIFIRKPALMQIPTIQIDLKRERELCSGQQLLKRRLAMCHDGRVLAGCVGVHAFINEFSRIRDRTNGGHAGTTKPPLRLNCP